MKVIVQLTVEEFTAAVGRPPEQDDMERTNCCRAGESRHKSCGVCVHEKPVFACTICFIKCQDDSFMRLGDFMKAKNKPI